MDRESKIFVLVFIAYLILLLKFAVFKDLAYLANTKHFQNYNIEYLKKSMERANLIPLKTIYYYASKQEKYETGILNVGGNVLLFLPMGLIIPHLRKKTNLKRVIKFSLCVSITLELLQLIIAYGTFDIDDMFLNVLGCLCGYLIYKYCMRKSTSNF